MKKIHKESPQVKLWKKNIPRMLKDPEYSFAKEYLTSVLEYMEEKNDITFKQLQGVLNIRRSKH